MRPGSRCGVCGVLLMGLATAHVCIETTHVEERRPEAVVLRTPYIFGSHEDRAAEFAVDLDIFARQVVAVATTSGDAPPGNSFRQQQEIAARWWNRNQREVWHVHAQRAQLFNQSGMDSTPSSSRLEDAVNNETLILDLPPSPPAYVEVCKDFSAPHSKEVIPEFRDDDRRPPEPPHDHEHIDGENSGAFQEDAFQRDAFQTGTSADL